jgi:hypothetical protein
MRRFRAALRKTMTLGAAFLLCAVLATPCLGEKKAPLSILRENCNRASAVVRGRIIGSEPEQHELTVTTFWVDEVIIGPIKAQTEIKYYSFREQAHRSNDQLDQELIVFLKRASFRGLQVWAPPTEFSEFAHPFLPDSFDCKQETK